MDLRVSVEITHTLDVHHNQLVAGTLKREVAEGLWGEKEKVTAETTPHDAVLGLMEVACYLPPRTQEKQFRISIFMLVLDNFPLISV